MSIDRPSALAELGNPAAVQALLQARTGEARRRGGGFFRHLLLNAFALVGAGVLCLIYDHETASGPTSHGYLWLAGAALLAMMPLRSVLRLLWSLESHFVHIVHGLGGLALFGLLAHGGLSSQPLLTHAALAPFAMMGAAQAVMHQQQPRDARQAEALRRFASSLPELGQLGRGNLSSPASVQHAATLLGDLIGKAQALGYTELDADPGFQSALRHTTTRLGLTLVLDRVQSLVTELGKNPASAQAAAGLQRRLDAARKITARASQAEAP